MKSRRCLYGLTGLLSLLGFIGIFTESRLFLAFSPLRSTLSTSLSSPMKC